MIDLASRQQNGPVALTGIAERQGISLSYLEQLFGRLRRCGLVSSVRGPGGGYRLARETRDIAVTDIVLAVDETLDATLCGGRQNCHDEAQCLTHDLWANLNKHIFAYLDSVTLGALVAHEVRAEPPEGVLACLLSRQDEVAEAAEAESV
jgi:Rrf2 family iron-sulfur cluster assembly transcriptional regulator